MQQKEDEGDTINLVGIGQRQRDQQAEHYYHRSKRMRSHFESSTGNKQLQ